VAIISDDDNIQKSLDINKKSKSENLETKEIAFDKSFENNIRPKRNQCRKQQKKKCPVPLLIRFIFEIT